MKFVTWSLKIRRINAENGERFRSYTVEVSSNFLRSHEEQEEQFAQNKVRVRMVEVSWRTEC